MPNVRHHDRDRFVVCISRLFPSQYVGQRIMQLLSDILLYGSSRRLMVAGQLIACLFQVLDETIGTDITDFDSTT